MLKPSGKLFVFDGNHYCYLFNEDYASIQPKVNESSNHVLLGVKTNVIDDLARELPLSRKLRPQWDEEVLKQLGAKEVKSEVLLWEGENHRLPVRFAVTAVK